MELLLDALRLLVSIVGALVRLRRFQTFDLGGVELRKEPRDGSFAFLSRGVEASYFILEFPQDCGVRVFCGFCTIRLCLYTICLCRDGINAAVLRARVLCCSICARSCRA